MTEAAGNRPRPARWRTWLVVGVAVLVLLAVAVFVWFFAGLPRGEEQARDDALADVRQSAEGAGRQLLDATRADSLSETEVTTILSRSQATLVRLKERPREVEVVAEVHAPYQTGLGSAGLSRCFRFVLSESAEPVLSTTELERCPSA